MPQLMKSGSQETSQSMQRVRVGVTGLAMVMVLIALAHLAYPRPHQAAGPKAAEFGGSVLPQVRGRGYGARLFEHAMLHARNRGVDTMLHKKFRLLLKKRILGQPVLSAITIFLPAISVKAKVLKRELKSPPAAPAMERDR